MYLLSSEDMGCDVNIIVEYWLAFAVVGSVLVLMVVLVAVGVKYSDAIAFLLYLKFDILIGRDPVTEDLENMEFDAFVTYR